MVRELSTFDNNTEYYIENKKKIFKQFNSLIKVVKEVVLSVYKEANVNQIEEKARNEFDNLLSRLPYVGGDASPFTPLMIQSAETVAFYKASKPLNLTKRELGKLIYEITEKYSQLISPIKKWLYRKAIFSKRMKNYWKKWLKESQTSKYPENWVGEFREGDNENFNYGIDFTECGCLKLMQKEGVEEITPYICLCDYARMQTLGIGFKRTKTIANGAELCDFRFIRTHQTQRGWPPENLEEFKPN